MHSFAQKSDYQQNVQKTNMRKTCNQFRQLTNIVNNTRWVILTASENERNKGTVVSIKKPGTLVGMIHRNCISYCISALCNAAWKKKDNIER